MLDHYERITRVLRHFTEHYHLQICVKDFIGFIHLDRRLDTALSRYVAHTNPYCLFIKQELGQYTRCLDMIRPMYEKCCGCTEGFLGVCHAGVYEYVVPIQLEDGEVLGSVNLGYVDGDREISHRLIRRNLREREPAVADQALALFDRYIPAADVRVEEIKPYLWLLADSMAQNYAQFQSSHVNRFLPQRQRESNADMILDRVLKYVKENYSSHMTVAELAQICLCSESYINHLFARRFGVNISTYINKVRIEYAKNALLTTTDKISTVAMDVGFSDPSYFSKVFAALLGISPSEFRRRYTT